MGVKAFNLYFTDLHINLGLNSRVFTRRTEFGKSQRKREASRGGTVRDFYWPNRKSRKRQIHMHVVKCQ